MSFLKKTAAVLTASALLSAAAALPVQAADTEVLVEIDQVTLTVEELKELDYRVPVAVSLSQNPGVNAIEFGVTVDERCTYEIVSRMGLMTPDERMFIIRMTSSAVDSLSWLVWADSSALTDTGVLACYYVTVPETAAAGDVYTIDYLPEQYSTHLWNDNLNGIRYVELGAVSWVDGSITITGDPSEPIKGDVNSDNEVNISDVLTLNKNLLAGEKLTEQGILNADVDGDGVPTAADALMILKYTVRILDTL